MKSMSSLSSRYLAYRLDTSCLPAAGAHPASAVALPRPEVFVPTLFHLFLPGEKRTFKAFLTRLCFALMTRFRMRIFYVRAEDGGLAHKSCVIPHCFKFPFLGAGDYEIGPCLTYPAHRRKGLYVHVLRCILESEIGNSPESRTTRYYMFVHENNLPSIKGIERAGFSRIGFATVSRWLKIYRLQCLERD